MNILIDLLGALMVATLLLLMMITFQLQLRDTADRTIFAAQMMTHVQRACQELNGLIAMAGVQIPLDEVAVTVAAPAEMQFDTHWDYYNNQYVPELKTVKLALNPSPTAVGYELDITQGTPIEELANILWIEDLSYFYYDIEDNPLGSEVLGSDRTKIYSVDVNMTFKRDAPTINTTPLRTRIQLRCYLMNRYLQYAP